MLVTDLPKVYKLAQVHVFALAQKMHDSAISVNTLALRILDWKRIIFFSSLFNTLYFSYPCTFDTFVLIKLDLAVRAFYKMQLHQTAATCSAAAFCKIVTSVRHL